MEDLTFTGLTTKFIDKFHREQKYVIHKFSSLERMHLYDMYAIDLWPGSSEKPYHADIVKGFKLDEDRIIGGGRIKRVSPEEIVIFGESTKYKGVPKDLLEFYKQEILNGYKAKFPEIERIVLDVAETTENDHKAAFLREMGFIKE